MKEKYDLSFEEAQDLESKTGLDVYSNDGDIFINENDITRTIGNVLQFGIDYQKAIDDAHLESVVAQWKTEEEMWIEQEQRNKLFFMIKAHKAFVELLAVQYGEECDESMHQYIDDALKKYLEE